MAQTTSLYTLKRTRITALMYALMVYFGLTQTIPGPANALLREELNLSFTVAGLHSTLFAVGGLLVGAFGERYAARVGNRGATWSGAALGAGGILVYAAGQTPFITIPAIFAMGLGCTMMATMVSAVLGDEHRERRAVALTESSTLASVGVFIAPLLVGGFESAGLGWRIAAVMAAGLLGLIALVFWSASFPPSLETTDATAEENSTRLPPIYWIYGAVLFLGVAIEWSFIFWTGDYLIDTTGIAPDTASTLVSVFLVAMLIGRVIGSRLTRRFLPGRILFGAIILTVLAFPFFWLGEGVNIKVGALFVVGFGVANLFPQALSACLLVAPTQTNRASARIALMGGSAILLAPQTLGVIADAAGIQTAYGAILLLCVVAVFVVLYANRRAHRLLSTV